MNRYDIGTIHKSKQYGDFEIIKKYDYSHYRIKFLKTGTEKDISLSCIRYGEVRDPYYPIYFNKACIGNVKIDEHRKELNLWKFMIFRCYNKEYDGYKLYGAKGVTVCDRWLCFENFLEDIKNIKGYNEEKFNNGELELDKDLSYSGSGNKIYSLYTCEFVSYKVNFQEMLARRKLKTSSRYVGVTKLKDGKWQSTLYHNGEYIYIGRFETEKEAHIEYEKLKRKLEENKNFKIERKTLIKDVTILYEDGHEEVYKKGIKKLTEEFNVTYSTLMRYSAKKKFLNGIMIKDISPDKYSTCKSYGARYNGKFFKDPIKGDICTYYAFYSRRSNNREKYKNINIKDYLIDNNETTNLIGDIHEDI